MSNHLCDYSLDMLECDVKWVLRSLTMNKASGGDGIPAELLHILGPTITVTSVIFLLNFLITFSKGVMDYSAKGVIIMANT